MYQTLLDRALGAFLEVLTNLLVISAAVLMMLLVIYAVAASPRPEPTPLPRPRPTIVDRSLLCLYGGVFLKCSEVYPGYQRDA